MINSIRIENFRGFESLELGGFSKFNLIVGTNGVGKTSFLEALFLARTPDPRVLTALDAPRGWQRQFARIDTRGVWGYLFGDPNRALVVSSEAGAYSARVEGVLQPAGTSLLTREASGGNPAYTSLSQADLSTAPAEDLHWQLTVNGNLEAEILAHGTALGVVVQTLKAPAQSPKNKQVFVPQHTGITPELLETFSSLKAAGRIAPLLVGLRVLAPWIDEVELMASGGVTLAASGLGHRMVPLPFLGEGVMRLAQLLLNVAYVDRGILLIDEIERGFHHAVLPDIWRALRAAIGESDVQVFATTHSYECIAAADAAFADAPSDLALFRLQQVNGKLRAISYPPEARSTAIEFGSEVR